MSFVEAKLTEETFTPTGQKDIGTTPSCAWADIEDVLSAEWEIGGSAIPIDAICGLVADE